MFISVYILWVINLEFILKLIIKHNDWLLADMCPQAANDCALFLSFRWYSSSITSRPGVLHSISLYPEMECITPRFTRMIFSVYSAYEAFFICRFQVNCQRILSLTHGPTGRPRTS